MLKKVIYGLLILAILVVMGCSSSQSGSKQEEPAANEQSALNQQTADSGTQEVDPNSFQYITAEELKARLEAKEKMFIVDLQTQADYDKKHIVGSISTDAFGMDTDEKKDRVAALVKDFSTGSEPIVLICPKGKSNAEKAFNLYLEKGIDRSRLLILKDGMTGWPYDDLTASAK